MKVQPTKRLFISLESVAMTDIVMNLFIFFFISFSLLYTFNPEKNKESKIEVKLPAGQATEKPGSSETLVVSITAGNEIYVEHERVLPDNLVAALQTRKGKKNFTGVLVKSDKAASVDYLVKTLDAAKQAGLQKLGVAILNEA